MAGFYCSCCGQYHDSLPLSYDVPAPSYWLDELVKDEKSELGQDICIIKGEQFFIKGNVEIPILDSPNLFVYRVWVSLSVENFKRAVKLWNDPNRTEEKPYFGWFSCQLPGYPETLSLKTLVHTRVPGIVPYIELEPTDHPLAIEQRDGVSLERVKEIAELNLHSDDIDFAKTKPFGRRLQEWLRGMRS